MAHGHEGTDLETGDMGDPPSSGSELAILWMFPFAIFFYYPIGTSLETYLGNFPVPAAIVYFSGVLFTVIAAAAFYMYLQVVMCGYERIAYSWRKYFTTYYISLHFPAYAVKYSTFSCFFFYVCDPIR